MQPNRFIYHYSGHYYQGNSKTTIDGIAIIENRIKSMADYQALKEQLDCPDADKFCIVGLSFLGMEQEGGK